MVLANIDGWIGLGSYSGCVCFLLWLCLWLSVVSFDVYVLMDVGGDMNLL